MFGIGSTGIKVGEVYAEGGFKVNEAGFHEYDRRLDKASRSARIPRSAEGKMDVHEAGFRRFDHNLDRADRHAAASSHRIRGALGAIAQGVGLAGVAAGVFGFKAVQAASDINEQITAGQQLFGRSAAGIERWSKRTATAMGVSRREALLATNDYGALFATIGLSEKPAAAMSERLVKLSSDIASFRNADPSEVLEALKSGLIGEAEPMRRFGALLTETRVQNEAYQSGIAKTGSVLTEGQKVQARYNLILRDTEKAHGDFARTSGGLANQQRILSARWDDLQGKAGKLLLPIALKLTHGFNRLFTQMERGKGTGGQLRDTLSSLGDIAKSKGGAVLHVLEGAVGFAKEHPQITKAAAGLTAAWLALRGIGSVSRATPVGRGMSALTAAVAGAAVTHAAHEIASRGGLLGRLASRFLAPGETPARPLFVKEVGIPGAGGRGGGGDGVAGKVGKIATGATAARLLPIFGTTGAIAGLVAVGYIATSMKLSRRDRERIEDRTGSPSSDGRGAGGGAHGDITPGTIGDPRGVRRAPVGGLDESARATAVAEGNIGKATRRIEQHFARMRNRTGDDVQAMMRAVARNAGRIRDELGENTAAGRRALERNMDGGVRSLSRALRDGDITTRRYTRSISRLMDANSGAGADAMRRNLDRAATAVRTTMRRSGQITKEGMETLKSLYVRELRLYGLSPKEALASANVRTGEVAGGFRRQDYAGGGIIGRWGERGKDLVHAVLGRGEAVLNHAQQALVNGLLRAKGLPGGLRDVFTMTKGTRHHYAGGGIVGIPWAPGEEIAGSILPLATRLHNMFGSTVTDAFDRDRSAGHQSPGHNVTGTAVDWAGGDLLGLVRWTVAHGFKTLYNTPPGTPWPGHSDHAHVEFGSGGAFAAAVAKLKRIVVQGRPSPLRDLVQAALDNTRGAAQTRMERLMGSVSGGGSSAGGQYNKADLARLWIRAGGDPGIAQLMAAIALAESNGDPRAHNPSGASGLWQILGEPFPGDVYDPLTNAKMAVAKYESQGLGAWEAYTNGNYTKYLGEGGLVFAAGGHDPMTDLPGAVQESAPHGTPDYGNAVGPGGGLTWLGRKLTSRANRVIRRLERHIEDLGNKYELKNRRFDLTEEELINEGDEDTPPTFNEDAIKRRARELTTLMGIRGGQVKDYGKLVRYLRRLRSVYSTQRNRMESIVGRTQKRLKGLPDKGGTKEQKRARRTLQARLEKYQRLLGTVRTRLGDVGEGIRSNVYERKSTILDVAELRKELDPLNAHLGGLPGGLELPEWQGPDTSGDDSASLEQERSRTAAATTERDSLRAAIGALTGTGDLGAGGQTALGAVLNPGSGYVTAPDGSRIPVVPGDGSGGVVSLGGDGGGLNIHIHSVVPPSREQAAEIGRAAASGFEQQAPAIASREAVRL